MSLLRQILLDSAAGYWPLDEVSGTTAVDRSGNGRDGSYSAGYTLAATGLAGGKGTTITGEASGTGLITFPTSITTVLSGDATIEWWFNPTSSFNGYNIIASTEGSQFAAPFEVQSLSGGFINVVFGASGSETGSGAIGSAIPLNQWHHVAITMTGSTTYELYQNGVNTASLSMSRSRSDGGDVLRLGVRKSGSAQRGTSGTYAPLAVFPSVLSASRIKSHYEAGVRSGVTIG